MFKIFFNTKFKKDLFFSYFSQGINIFFSFIHMILINKYFGVDIFGQLSIILSTIGIFSALLTSRSNEAVTRFFTREVQSNNLSRAKLTLYIGLFIDFTTALMLVIIVYFLSNYISTTFIKDSTLKDEVFLYSIITFFIFLRGTFIGYFQSKEMFKVINNSRIIESFFKVFLIIFIIGYFDNTLFLIIISLMFSSIFSLLYLILISFKCYKKDFIGVNIKFDKDFIKEYWSFNLKTFISSSFKVGAGNIDNIILGYFTNAESVGIYQIMKKSLSPISFLVTPFNSLTIKKIVAFFEIQNFKSIHNLVKNVTVKLIIINLILGFLLILILKPYLSYQNIEYKEYYSYAFFILFLYYLLPALTWWGRNFIIMYNPSIPIYTNLLHTINSIWIPIVILHYSFFEEDLISISISALLAYIPSWIFIPIVYINFMKTKKVI